MKQNQRLSITLIINCICRILNVVAFNSDTWKLIRSIFKGRMRTSVTMLYNLKDVTKHIKLETRSDNKLNIKAMTVPFLNSVSSNIQLYNKMTNTSK